MNYQKSSASASYFNFAAITASFRLLNTIRQCLCTSRTDFRTYDMPAQTKSLRLFRGTGVVQNELLSVYIGTAPIQSLCLSEVYIEVAKKYSGCKDAHTIPLHVHLSTVPKSYCSAFRCIRYSLTNQHAWLLRLHWLHWNQTTRATAICHTQQ